MSMRMSMLGPKTVDGPTSVKSEMFDGFNTKDSIKELLITLRIATDGYPSSESRYVNVKEFLKDYNAL